MRDLGRLVKRLVFLGVSVGLACACNPNGCVSEVSPTVGNLVFTSWSATAFSGPTNNGVIESKDTVPAIANDFWGPRALGGPSAGLALTNVAFDTIGITYLANPPPATALQQEVDVFARDPR